MGSHRELSEITEQDILSIAVSADVSFDSFFEGAQEIVSGFENYSTSQIDGATGKIAERIVDNAQPRLQVVRRLIAAN